MPSTTKAPKTTTAQREAKALATRVAKLRANGTPWDGDNGICAMPGMPKTATAGRKLLRAADQVKAAGGIAPSYERTAAFKAEESARRKAKLAADAKPVKAPRKPAAKRTAKK